MPRKAKTPAVEEIQEVKVDFNHPPKEKKKRNINPDTMTYIKALAIWKKETGKKGISPKKGSAEYDQVMKIFREHQPKKD